MRERPIKILFQFFVPLMMSVFMMSCGSKQQAGTTSDSVRPRPGSAITFSDITHLSFKMSWGEASDNVSSKENLQYRVVMADAYIKLNLVSRAASIEGNGVLQDWCPYEGTVSVVNLYSEVTYWVNVIVKDEAGNQEIYAPRSVRTLQSPAPKPGNSITFEETGTNTTTVRWGAAEDKNHPSEVLEYKLIVSDASQKIDTVMRAGNEDEYDEFTFAVWSEDDGWKVNELSYTVTGLEDGTHYYFAVLVKNPDGAIALYAPERVTTVDITPPEIINPSLSFDHVTASSIRVVWQSAKDNLTSPDSLKYMVLRGDSESDLDHGVEELSSWIDGIPECSGASGACRVYNDWSVNATSAMAAGLTDWTYYYFTVVVKDEADKMSMYSIQSEKTLDGTAPDTDGKVITFSEVGETSLKIIWQPASDTVTDPDFLLYRLVKFRKDMPITYQEAEETTDAEHLVWEGGWSVFKDLFEETGTVAKEITDLTYNDSEHGEVVGVEYGFWVLVKDQIGNVANYQVAYETTLDGTSPWLPQWLPDNPNDIHPLYFSEIKSTSARVNWKKATDNLTDQEDLEYLVLRADSPEDLNPGEEDLENWVNGLSLTDCTSESELCRVLDWGVNAESVLADNLEFRSESYYFAVVVKDARGLMSMYPLGSVPTQRTWEFLGEIDDSVELDSVAIKIRTEEHLGQEYEVPYVAYIKTDPEDNQLRYVAVAKHFDGTWTSVGDIETLKEEAITVDLEVGEDKKLYVAYADFTGIGKIIRYDDVNTWSSLGEDIVSTFYLDIARGSYPIVAYNNMFTSVVGELDMSGGYTWSNNSFDITIDEQTTKTIVLNGSDSGLEQVIARLNTAFSSEGVSGVVAVASGNYVELRSDSGKMFKLENGGGTALGILDIDEGTYYASWYGLLVRYLNGTTWGLLGDPVIGKSDSFMLSSLAMVNQVPYLLYQNNTDQSIHVKKYDQVEGVYAWRALGNSIGLSSGGTIGMSVKGDIPYVAYVNDSYSATVKYYSEGSGWLTIGANGFDLMDIDKITIELYSYVEGEVTITEPYVAFRDIDNSSKATVMYYDDPSWRVAGERGFSPGSVNYISLAIDAGGMPYVAFRDASNKLTVMVYK